ncbi:hypothetical protein AWC26_14945 [Mycobacterium shimoidei]|nr:hypothetical protein BHQ16_11540 [Mycobacterium shimoidei]ORW79702.1 hypothetical protein AWC26_14945 [Mycobacterium shimoidei]
MVSAVLAGLIAGPIVALATPRAALAVGWTRGLLVLAGFSLIIGALAAALQEPICRSYGAALTGLSWPQRQQAVRALRRGEVPADPAVRTAAARVGELFVASTRPRSRVQASSVWWVPGLWLVLGLLGLAGGDVRRAVMWAGLAAVTVILSARNWYRRRRTQARLELLRSASDPGADRVVLPPQRRWPLVVGALVVGAGAAVVVYAWDRPSPDCRTANAVMRFIGTHRDMLDAQLITPGDPALSRYQDWSDQLQHYSTQVSAPDIAPHVHRIAELSEQAVSLVRDARKDRLYSPSTDEMFSRQSAYQNTIAQLVEEDTALSRICR